MSTIATTYNQVTKLLTSTVHQLTPGADVLLFGSRARGDASAESDWDVMVLLPNNVATIAKKDEVSYSIRQLGWELNEIINPIVYADSEWQSKSHTPFYKNVLKEGIYL